MPSDSKKRLTVGTLLGQSQLTAYIRKLSQGDTESLSIPLFRVEDEMNDIANLLALFDLDLPLAQRLDNSPMPPPSYLPRSKGKSRTHGKTKCRCASTAV